MIQKLEYETYNDGNGNVYGSIPSDAEILDKINEVIDVLNQMLKKKEQIGCLETPCETSALSGTYTIGYEPVNDY